MWSPSEHLQSLLLLVTLSHVQLDHEFGELIKLYKTSALHIQFVDHIVDLTVSRVLAHAPQHRDQLLRDPLVC